MNPISGFWPKGYGTLQLVESSPVSFDEPISLEDAKVFLKCQTATHDEDFLISNYIAAARETAEFLQGRDLVPKRWDLFMDGFCYGAIELRHPLRTVESIQYTDSACATTVLTEDTDYVKDIPAGLVMPVYGGTWPSFTPYPSGAVRVRFTSGYSATHPFWSHAGARIKQGMAMLITGWYWHRIPFVPGESQIAELPFGVTKLLSFGAKERVW